VILSAVGYLHSSVSHYRVTCSESWLCRCDCSCWHTAVWRTLVCLLSRSPASTKQHACTVITVYRLAFTSAQSVFFCDELLKTAVTRSQPVYVVGELSVWLERDDNANAVRLLFGVFGLGRSRLGTYTPACTHL